MLPTVETRCLRKQYGKAVALQECSLSLSAGQILGLLGPNGAGKSTLLRLLAGILRPDSGKIFFSGEPFRHHHQRFIGYLPEERGLYRRHRVEELLLYFARLRGIGPEQARQAIGFWLDRLGIAQYRSHRVDQLSRGTLQVVQLAAALLHHPHLLLLDEPTNSLDPVNAHELGKLLRDLRDDGRAIILSTHRMEQVEELCDEVALLHRGRIVLTGNLRDIKQNWGHSTLILEFRGDITPVLQRFHSIHLLNQTNTRVELQWPKGFSAPQDFLRTAAEHVEIHHFAWNEPSIRNIFLEAVRDQEKEQRSGMPSPSS
ncbi:MAG: ATP-binding cassette domain-containing protein [Candidatus Kapabacteria bacterium]|nr:ATP-binding cassette domain-containing protein [Candidatus Kapabacteria bacterium]MDW8224900.1 ATP-binding cassette domain-containing protein [Bacteroidota bacterium]